MKIEFIVSPPPNTAGIGGGGKILFGSEEIPSIKNFYKTYSVYKLDDVISLDQFCITEYHFTIIDGILTGEATFKFRDYINRLDLL